MLADPPAINAVAKSGQTRECRRGEKRVIAEASKEHCAADSAERESKDQDQPQAQPPTIARESAQPMSKKNPEVGEDTRDVSGPNDRAAERARHRVLQPARGGRKAFTGKITAPKQRNCGKQQPRLHDECDAVAPAEVKRAVLN